MRQYCSVCKAHFDMSVVSESAEDGVVWLKCPNCQGILPHMPEDDAAMEAVEGGDSVTVEDPLAGIDVESARPYLPSETYEVGDVVHHRGWNDFGVVTAKESLPGQRHVIRVRFAENGEVQLLERVGG